MDQLNQLDDRLFVLCEIVTGIVKRAFSIGDDLYHLNIKTSFLTKGLKDKAKSNQ